MQQDDRTTLERLLWDSIGPPLYYCAECLRGVRVTAVEGQEPTITRACAHAGQIIAPRKAVASGKGGIDLPLRTRAAIKAGQIASAITGRSV